VPLSSYKLTKEQLKPPSIPSASIADLQNDEIAAEYHTAPPSVTSSHGIRVIPAPESVGASINSEASNSHEQFDPTNGIFKLKPHPQHYDLANEKLDGNSVGVAG
jgi:hypothetical protein